MIKNFNPRTHVGCDTRRPRGIRINKYFNPRTHVGCDEMWGSAVPVRGYFNPRTHVGCDEVGLYLWNLPFKFQSTHPRGVRLLSHQMVGF